MQFSSILFVIVTTYYYYHLEVHDFKGNIGWHLKAWKFSDEYALVDLVDS